MLKIVVLDETLAVAGQPEEGDFAQIAQQGFKSVINNRPDGEPGALGQALETQLAQAAGLDYRYIPMTMNSLSPYLVNEFHAALAELPKPILAHCRSGTRCALLWAIDTTSSGALAVDEALEKTAAEGYDLSGMRSAIESLS
jgi:uncharacterized protein (TIGR01244 family)